MNTRLRTESSFPDDDEGSITSLLESIHITPRSAYNAVPPPDEFLARSPRTKRGYVPRPKYHVIDSGLDDPYLPYNIDGVSPEEQEHLQADLQIGRWKALSSSLSGDFVRERSRDSLPRVALSPPLASRFVKASSPGSSSSRPGKTNSPRTTAPSPGDHGPSLRNTARHDIGKNGESARWFDELSSELADSTPPVPPQRSRTAPDSPLKDLPGPMMPLMAIFHAANLQCTNCKSWACRHGDGTGGLCGR